MEEALKIFYETLRYAQQVIEPLPFQFDVLIFVLF